MGKKLTSGESGFGGMESSMRGNEARIWRLNGKTSYILGIIWRFCGITGAGQQRHESGSDDKPREEDRMLTTTLIWLLAAVFVLLIAHLFLLTRRVLRVQADLWETDRAVRQIEERLRETAPDDTIEEEE